MKTLNNYLKVLDLFSGIGGFSLGLERAGMKTIAFCEIEPYCRKILKQHWPDIPIYDDIRELTSDELPAKPDVVCGGYPCQPFSVAGKQRGKADHRHLWPEMHRIIKETEPKYVIAENVAGHVNMGLDDVLSDLENAGYTTWPFVIPACALDARHRRDRVWIIGYSYCNGESVKSQYDESEIMPVMGNTEHDGLPTATIKRESGKTGQRTQKRPNSSIQFAGAGRPSDNEIMANSHGARMQARVSKQEQWHERESEEPNHGSNRQHGRTQISKWAVEPPVGRVVDGIPNRVDRIKALGNAVVPQIPQILGEFIIDFHNENIKSCFH